MNDLRGKSRFDSERAVYRAEIPGALLLLIARALREIDLPGPTYAALRDQLTRFGSVDGTLLSLVHDRVLPVYVTLLVSGTRGADVFSPSFAPDGHVLLFNSGRNHSALMWATFDDTGTPAVATVLRDRAANYHATV